MREKGCETRMRKKTEIKEKKRRDEREERKRKKFKRMKREKKKRKQRRREEKKKNNITRKEQIKGGREKERVMHWMKDYSPSSYHRLLEVGMKVFKLDKIMMSFI